MSDQNFKMVKIGDGLRLVAIEYNAEDEYVRLRIEAYGNLAFGDEGESWQTVETFPVRRAKFVEVMAFFAGLLADSNTDEKVTNVSVSVRDKSSFVLQGGKGDRMPPVFESALDAFNNKSLTRSVKCAVHDCVNFTDQGRFVGEFCGPCHSLIIEGENGGTAGHTRIWRALHLLGAVERAGFTAPAWSP